jgi:c-di-GMP-binding flagellar brake protein YcgR
MFAKTFSFWRRLVHKAPAEAEACATTVQEDRRLWLRYTANLSAQVHLAHEVNSQRVAVQVRDLSLGGASLQVQVPFETGQLLTVELPTQNNELRTVLACVVRVVSEQAQNWLIGCVFSRELSSEDLEAFGARRVEPGEADQRRWKRFACDHPSQYQVVGDPENRSYSAQILNISASGIGLQVNHPLEAGALLSLDLLDREGQPVRSILACVVHTTLRASGECALGCNFIRELAEDELRSLL